MYKRQLVDVGAKIVHFETEADRVSILVLLDLLVCVFGREVVLQVASLTFVH